MTTQVIAIDIGASSGRIMVATLDGKRLSLQEVHRFPNRLCHRNNQVCWDTDALLAEIYLGIQHVLDAGITPACIGIDTWGVDFVLLDKEGHRLGQAASYRDSRTDGVMDAFLAEHQNKAEVYTETGIQFLPFNTLYQLAALLNPDLLPLESASYRGTRTAPEWLGEVATLLFIPDYLNYRLTGVKHCEYTNASTSQLLGSNSRQWSSALLDKIGAPSHWFLPPQQPNQIIGHYQTQDKERQSHQIPVASIASHDTASAVVGTPLSETGAVYLCSGTWSLMGLERAAPIINALSLNANITNEGGSEGLYRVLKNIMGMWLIQRLQQQYPAYSFSDLAALAKQAPAFAYLINPDDKRFLHPNNMEQSIIDYCLDTGQGAPGSLGQIVRCIYDSLALRYRQVFLELQHLSDSPLSHIHIVGGGAQNHFLNQLCADICEVPVCANPTEASAIGNALGQLVAIGRIANISEGRHIVRQSFELTQYSPNAIAGLKPAITCFEQLTQTQ